MANYKKINRDQVFECFSEQCAVLMGLYQASVPFVSQCLKTSKYQVRKYVKELVKDDLLKRISTNPYYPEDGESLPLHGFTLTSKGIKTEVHKKHVANEIAIWESCCESN